MPTKKAFHITELASLTWPMDLGIPSRRFRLFVVADTTGLDVSVIAEFAHAALTKGMVSFSAWGPGCSRFHDIVDEEIVADELGERLFAGPNKEDTIMTTWHEKDTLHKALDFFVHCSVATRGLSAGSDYWLAMSVGNSEWAATIERYLKKNR